jgi:hypothetical protein
MPRQHSRKTTNSGSIVGDLCILAEVAVVLVKIVGKLAHDAGENGAAKPWIEYFGVFSG